MPTPKTVTLALSTLAVAAAAAGCGSEQQNRQPGSEGSQAAASDVAAIIDARRTIRDACRNGGVGAAQLTDAVATIRQLTEEAPSARFESGNSDTPQTLTSVAGDTAGILDRCGQPDLARQLREVATGKSPVQKGSPGF